MNKLECNLTKTKRACSQRGGMEKVFHFKISADTSRQCVCLSCQTQLKFNLIFLVLVGGRELGGGIQKMTHGNQSKSAFAFLMAEKKQ